MWILITFDLPTKTAAQRRAYRGFRRLLRQRGFVYTQHSIYVRHHTRMRDAARTLAAIKKGRPKQGRLAILQLSDACYAGQLCYVEGVLQRVEGVKPPLLCW